MSKGAQRSGSANATYRVIRQLGSRRQQTWAATREPSIDAVKLLVVQRFARTDRPARGRHSDHAGCALDAEAMALLLRDARCLAKSSHPNIARVWHAELAGSELTIASELYDGATLEDLFAAEQLPVPVLARILLDVLAGLQALHSLRDGLNAPLDAIHGELCPANVVVGRDGVARIVNVLRKRPVAVEQGSEAIGYAAPEALDASGTDDPRSDLHAVGVMLSVGIAGRRLHDERLNEVAMRALAFDPSLRFSSAADMAAELRTAIGSELAQGGAVAAKVTELAGERIDIRRATLERSMSGTRPRASEGAIRAAKAARAVQVSKPAGDDVPISLLGASRPSDAGDPVEGLVLLGDEEEVDLPGPRASAPDFDIAERFQEAQALLAASAVAESSSVHPAPAALASPLAEVAKVAKVEKVEEIEEATRLHVPERRGISAYLLLAISVVLALAAFFAVQRL